MNFIETLKLRSKLFFLFVIITVGLIVIGVMGAVNIKSMKKNLDSLYFGSFVPVIELNNILHSYQDDIVNSIYRAKNTQISSQELEAVIKEALQRIQKEWKNYEGHFKRDSEIPYVDYTAEEIRQTNAYFDKVVDALGKGYDVKDLILANLENRLSHTYSIINRLISYEIEVAKYDRKNFLLHYDSTFFKVGSILAGVIFFVLMISYYVFKSIQNDQNILEVTTKKLKLANKKLENVSYTDSLTGLYNRRYFNLVYDRELKRAKRSKSYITFLMLDIDYFKQYNDTYGHIEGDFALKSVAKILKDTLKRPGDFLFRLGGEEFGILLGDTSEVNSKIIAQSVCDAVKGREIKHESSKAGEFITVSIGGACCVADEALDDEILISKADEMLYKAKEKGRDRCEITTDISFAEVREEVKASA